MAAAPVEELKATAATREETDAVGKSEAGPCATGPGVMAIID